jgi:hypothetical protein
MLGFEGPIFVSSWLESSPNLFHNKLWICFSREATIFVVHFDSLRNMIVRFCLCLLEALPWNTSYSGAATNLFPCVHAVQQSVLGFSPSTLISPKSPIFMLGLISYNESYKIWWIKCYTQINSNCKLKIHFESIVAVLAIFSNSRNLISYGLNETFDRVSLPANGLLVGFQFLGRCRNFMSCCKPLFFFNTKCAHA